MQSNITMAVHSRDLIIGFGMVGKATAFALDIHNYFDVAPGEVDWEKESEANMLMFADRFYFAVPTPTVGTQDLSLLIEWLSFMYDHENIKDRKDQVEIIIRSTVLPKRARELIDTYPEFNFLFWPEFLTESMALHDAQHPELIVVGGDDILRRNRFANFLKERLSGTPRLMQCSPETACVVKYSMNSFFALKVIMANQLFDACQATGNCNYGDVIRALSHHKWGSKNGWNVFHGGSRGYGGKCLPKDVEAFTDEYSLSLMKEVIKINKGLTDEST